MHRNKIFLIKFFHSIIFIFMSACLGYILYCAITRTYDWTLLTALGSLSINGLALLFNHCECPLTTLAKEYGDPKGTVTDILLPAWCARNVFRFATVFLAVGLVLLGLGYFLKS